jgi:hypothetical protein
VPATDDHCALRMMRNGFFFLSLVLTPIEIAMGLLDYIKKWTSSSSLSNKLSSFFSDSFKLEIKSSIDLFATLTIELKGKRIVSLFSLS